MSEREQNFIPSYTPVVREILAREKQEPFYHTRMERRKSVLFFAPRRPLEDIDEYHKFTEEHGRVPAGDWAAWEPQTGWFRERLLEVKPRSVLLLGTGSKIHWRDAELIILLTLKGICSPDIFTIDNNDFPLRAIKEEGSRSGDSDLLAQADATRLPFPGDTFDMLTAHFLFTKMKLAESKAAIKDSIRVLKPGGSFVIAQSVGPRDEYFQNIDKLTGWLEECGYEVVNVTPTTDPLVRNPDGSIKRTAKRTGTYGNFLIHAKKPAEIL